MQTTGHNYGFSNGCKLTELVCEHEAKQRWAAGEVPGFSSGLINELTCGYGECDFYGYWEFPLWPAEKYSKLLKEKQSDFNN